MSLAAANAAVSSLRTAVVTIRFWIAPLDADALAVAVGREDDAAVPGLFGWPVPDAVALRVAATGEELELVHPATASAVSKPRLISFSVPDPFVGIWISRPR